MYIEAEKKSVVFQGSNVRVSVSVNVFISTLCTELMSAALCTYIRTIVA